jgi:putative flippase GtrA
MPPHKKPITITLTTPRDLTITSILATAIGVLSIPIVLHINLPKFPVTAVSISFGIATLVALANAGMIVAGILGKHTPSIFQFCKYGANGVFSTVLDASIINVLTYLTQIYSGPWVIVFNTTSFAVVSGISYLTNRTWSFDTPHAPSLAEFAKYISASLGSLAINSVIIYILTTITGPLFGMSEPVWINIVKLLTAIVAMVWNFTTYKLFVFKR